MRNKFAGNCFRCGCHVPAGQGHPHREKGRWQVVCSECVKKHRKSKISDLDADFEKAGFPFKN